MAYTDILEYGDNVRREISRAGLVSEAHKVHVVVRDRKRATERDLFVSVLRFRNNATLNVEEKISVVDGEISRQKYSYHFQNGPFFFRYNKDPEASLGREYAHAACHLHVSGDGQGNMRYVSHETSFEEVFRFVLASIPSVSG